MPISVPLSPGAQALLAYICEHDYVSFVEMEKVLQPYLPTKGHWAFTHADYPNLLFWTDMSQEWLEVLDELLKANLVYREPASLLTYMVDGGLLKLPIAKRVPKGDYKTPHWLPICFRPIERQKPLVRRQKKGTRS